VFFDISDASFTINTPTSFLSISDVTVIEGKTGTATAIFNVTLSPTSASTVTVAYATADGTATAGSDYVGTSGSLTFAPGQSTRTISIVVKGDTVAEADETFFMNLSGATNATITDSQVIGTISNDDAIVVTPGIVDGTFEAGNPWPAWTVQSSTNFGTPLCDTTTCGGAPFAGSNWAFFGGINFFETATLGQTVVFPLASSLTLQFQMQVPTVPVTPESLVLSVDGTPVHSFVAGRDIAPPESAYSLRRVDLTAFADGGSHALLFSYENVPNLSDYATFFVDNVELVILPPTLSIDDLAVTEGNSGTTTATFTVTLSPPRGSTVTVNYATADRTAAAGSDYVAISGVLTFLAGETTKTIAVVVDGDATFEPTESFLVNLSNAANATITHGQGVGTIINDDGVAPTPGIVDGTFEAGSPYPDWTVQSSTNFGTPLCDLTLCGTGGGAAGPFAGANWAWFGGANAPEQSSIGQTVVLPRSNSLTLQFQMWVGMVTAPATDTLVVSVDGVRVQTFTEPGSAEAAYSLRQIDLTPFADGTAHTLLFTYNGPTTGIANFSVDNIELVSSPPTLPSISISDVVTPEGNSGAMTARFTVTLSTTSAQTVRVAYATANGTATAGSDYVSASGTLTFAPGTTTQEIAVVVSADSLNEPNETFFVNLSAPTNATLADAQGAGTINNDDPVPTLSINDVTVSEGNVGITNATFTITLSTASGEVITVDYTTADGTAMAAGNDYTTTSGMLTFAPGVTTQSITVPVIGDTTNEPNEVFFVNLGSPAKATIAGRPGVGTILNDDP
jgi:hypothetical protein